MRRVQRSRLGSLLLQPGADAFGVIWPSVFNRFSLPAACRSGLWGGRVGAATPGPIVAGSSGHAALLLAIPAPSEPPRYAGPFFFFLLMSVPLNVIVAHLEESERLRHPTEVR